MTSTTPDSPSKDPNFAVQKRILTLINDERNFLSIFQYIVKCSMSSNQSFVSGDPHGANSYDKSAKSGQSITGVNSEKNSSYSQQDQTMISPQHTPNSIYANQSHTPNSIYTNMTNYSNTGQ